MKKTLLCLLLTGLAAADLPPSGLWKVRENYAGQAFRIYVRKESTQQKRQRNEAIRAAYTGHNCKQLAAQFGLSMRQIFKIATGKI